MRLGVVAPVQVSTLVTHDPRGRYGGLVSGVNRTLLWRLEGRDWCRPCCRLLSRRQSSGRAGRTGQVLVVRCLVRRQCRGTRVSVGYGSFRPRSPLRTTDPRSADCQSSESHGGATNSYVHMCHLGRSPSSFGPDTTPGSAQTRRSQRGPGECPRRGTVPPTYWGSVLRDDPPLDLSRSRVPTVKSNYWVSPDRYPSCRVVAVGTPFLRRKKNFTEP